ncbi:MAG TPA: GNAT family N-acetyltransferase [Jiangellaceae bacterium]|nr:GNAT family N-acetyltransferase [Jiangellaceae bacterium]
MQPFELRGDGILLAAPTADDIDVLTVICQDAEIQQWTTVPSPYERVHAQSFVTEFVPQGWDSGRELTWAIRDPADRRVLGMIGLTDLGDRRGEIGYWLAPEARGQKVMSRAVRLVIDYAFAGEGLGLTHLLWQAFAGNWASRRVAWATGFALEGALRGGLAQRGARRDAWLGTLRADDSRTPTTPWLQVPVLRGEVAVLRPFEESDADSVTEACNDPVSQHWLGGLPSPYTREIALEYIHDRHEEAASARGVHWAAAFPTGGPAMGSFSLMGLDRHDGGAEVGYWLHPAARGRGMATDAVRLMVKHAFSAEAEGGLGLRRLTVAHVTGNDASMAVIKRAGFRPSGVERAADRIRSGTILDLHWYDLLSDDPRS